MDLNLRPIGIHVLTHVLFFYYYDVGNENETWRKMGGSPTVLQSNKKGNDELFVFSGINTY
jgi:hypothetical protein